MTEPAVIAESRCPVLQLADEGGRWHREFDRLDEARLRAPEDAKKELHRAEDYAYDCISGAANAVSYVQATSTEGGLLQVLIAKGLMESVACAGTKAERDAEIAKVERLLLSATAALLANHGTPDGAFFGRFLEPEMKYRVQKVAEAIANEGGKIAA